MNYKFEMKLEPEVVDGEESHVLNWKMSTGDNVYSECDVVQDKYIDKAFQYLGGKIRDIVDAEELLERFKDK